MRLTNQIVVLLCLCVIGTVLLVVISAGLGFHALTDRFQRDELRAVVDIFEQEVLMQPAAPRLQGWLPPLLQANGVEELTVTLDDALRDTVLARPAGIEVFDLHRDGRVDIARNAIQPH